MVSANFQTEMDRLQDSKPKIKVEFIDLSSTVTDISVYYLSGANFEQIKERAPDEIQSGSFDIELSNQDDKFSEFVSGSLLNGITYIGAQIRISLGLVLPDGTTEYLVEAVGIIDELVTNMEISEVTFRCRDRLHSVLDRLLHERPLSEKAISGPVNIGNGSTVIETVPFKTVTETWTLTCTTGGPDGTAVFDVVGSISGDVGDATSGTKFSTGTGSGGVQFTIKAGSIDWIVTDIFTFQTNKYPEWDAVNPIKILWSVLTGYNWDSNTQETWSDFVINLDNTQSSANTDIDYASFVTAINLSNSAFEALIGFVAYDEGAIEFIQNLLLIVQGSIFSNSDGKIRVKVFTPEFTAATATTFSDAKKIMGLGYNKTVDEIINHVIVNYKATKAWEFSNDTVLFDGVFVASDTTSISTHRKLVRIFNVRWFTNNGHHAEALANQVILRYKDPILNIDFRTGLDAATINIGDKIKVTDTKYGFSSKEGETAKIQKNFDAEPISIELRLRVDGAEGVTYGFLGSSANEGDGASPQASDFDSASSSDLDFCYLSQTGGGGPAYRMY